MDDEAPPLALQHGEREVTVVAVVEAVAFVEAADRVEEAARETHADRVDEGHILPRGPDGRPREQAVDDRAAHRPSVGPQPLGAVEASEPGAGLGERPEEPRQPRRLQHLRVVVQEAHELGVGEPPGAVERRDHAVVTRAPREGQRILVRKALEELGRAVGRAIVHHDQPERLGRGPETLEAGSSILEPVVDAHHEAHARRGAHGLPSAGRSGRTWRASGPCTPHEVGSAGCSRAAP